MKINGKEIGKGNPCFLIAEIGVNHNGDFMMACDMINIAKDVGVDAVKFQSYITDKLVMKSNESYDMLKKYELSFGTFEFLKNYCDSVGIIFLSTPFDVKSSDMLEDLGIDAYKISSGDLNNYQLLEHIAEKKMPIMISTGMSTIIEVGDIVYFLEIHEVEDIVIFQCTTEYPTIDSNVNLNVIDLYKERFPNHIIGFSDHSKGNLASLGAIAKGVDIIEKHFTMNKLSDGPDHMASMEPTEMFDWVQSIRKLERQLGSNRKFSTEKEIETRQKVRKSIVSIWDIKKGEKFTVNNVSLKRPVLGLSAIQMHRVLGSIAKKDILKNTHLQWSDIEI